MEQDRITELRAALAWLADEAEVVAEQDTDLDLACKKARELLAKEG